MSSMMKPWKSHPPLPQYLVGYTGVLYSVWVWAAQWNECQEVKITGGHRGDWPSQETKILCGNEEPVLRCLQEGGGM